MRDGAEIQQTIRFEAIHCCKCGIAFAVPANIRSRWLDSGQSFYCPNGHSQHYTVSNVQKLEKELAMERKRKEWAEQDAKASAARAKRAENSRRALKGVITKTKKRISAGTCPCCNRTFQQLARHMANQHPDYAGADSDDGEGHD